MSIIYFPPLFSDCHHLRISYVVAFIRLVIVHCELAILALRQAVDENGHGFATNIVSVNHEFNQRWVVGKIELGKLVIVTIESLQRPVLLVGE